MLANRWTPDLITQIDEGTNHIQRVVVVKHLLG